MTDLATAKLVLDLADTSFTLAKALGQFGSDRGKKSKPAPLTLSAFLGALPGAALNAADAISQRISTLRKDCLSAGLNLSNPISEQDSMLAKTGRQMRGAFPVRVNEIGLQISFFFDDVSALAQLKPRTPTDRKAKPPNAKKSELTEMISAYQPMGRLLDGLQRQVDDTREELRQLLGPA
jgi:hypothetical protein